MESRDYVLWAVGTVEPPHLHMPRFLCVLDVPNNPNQPGVPMDRAEVPGAALQTERPERRTAPEVSRSPVSTAGRTAGTGTCLGARGRRWRPSVVAWFFTQALHSMLLLLHGWLERRRRPFSIPSLREALCDRFYSSIMISLWHDKQPELVICIQFVAR